MKKIKKIKKSNLISALIYNIPPPSFSLTRSAIENSESSLSLRLPKYRFRLKACRLPLLLPIVKVPITLLITVYTVVVDLSLTSCRCRLADYQKFEIRFLSLSQSLSQGLNISFL